MKCSTCDGENIIDISAKCSDRFSMYQEADEHLYQYDGYVPSDIGIDDGSGDYIEFRYCLDCGQIQGNWPCNIPDDIWED